MRFLANENLSAILVGMLRERGHDVAWVKEDSPAASDPDNLKRAQAEKRVLVTFDRGFGWLAYRAGLPSECGIILLRIRGASPEIVAARVIEAIHTRAEWRGVFAVMENDRIRIRPLPPPSAPKDR